MVMAQAPKQPKLKIESVEFGGLTWYDMERPSEVETSYLAQTFSFHPLDLDDVLSKRQRPKIDEYKDYLFMVFHFPVYNKVEKLLTPSQLSVFIGPNYLITLHSGTLRPLIRLFHECEAEDECRKQFLTHGPGYLLYRIVDRLVDYCQPIVNKILENMDRIEDEIFAKHRAGTVKEISVLRRDIITFRRTIWPMRAVIAGLEPKLKRYIDTDLNVYFGDLIDHTDKIWDSLDECKEVIEALSATFDSMSYNNYNAGIRTLTIFATITLPLLLVTSIYGMNIPLPGQNWAHPIIVVLLITTGATIFTAWVLKRLKII